MKSYLILGGVLIAIVGLLVYPNLPKEADAAVDEFAQCLADSGAVMYGAEWCQYCKKEQNLFGASFRLIPYVECPKDTKTCIAEGVTGYPTWKFAEGIVLEGLQSFEQLSEASGCALPQSNTSDQ